MGDSERLERLEKVVEKLADQQATLINDLERYKGFWGGVLMVSSAVWACVVAWLELK